eukprot:10388365-Ditylum_brightwellii.AAC.1
MHKDNRTQYAKDCYELNQRTKSAKTNPSYSGKGHVAYKDLNTFVSAKVMEALKKAKKEQKKAKKNGSDTIMLRALLDSGKFYTAGVVKPTFKMPELNPTAKIDYKFHVAPTL